MTISLTHKEMRDILSKVFKTTITSFDLVEDTTLYDKIVNYMHDYFGSAYYTNETGGMGPANRKIEAIRQLKQCVDINLSTAKWAIENWSQWLTFVKKHNRIVDICYANNPYTQFI